MSKSLPLIPIVLGALFVLCATIAIEARVRDELAKKDDNVVVVSMKDKKFDSAKVTIKVGQTVKWVNDDEHDHTVLAEDGSFKSENISAEESFSFTFSAAGKNPYSCTYHPRMKGVIIVVE
jgi:plastocyanin